MSQSEYAFTLLGTGSSGGVPRINGDWGDCDPNEPKNARTRCCALIERFGTDGGVTRCLIDTSPDLRTQLLAKGVPQIDAIVYTHDHADQVHGIDDVRPFAMLARRAIPTYLSQEGYDSLSSRFAYCFKGKGGYAAILDDQPVFTHGKEFTVHGPGGPITLLPIEMVHGRIKSFGFRIGDLAYCNDVNIISDESLSLIDGVTTFIVDALRYTPHPSHANLEQALAWVERLSPKRSILTNLHLDMDYATLCSALPQGVEPAFDGLTIGFSVAR